MGGSCAPVYGDELTVIIARSGGPGMPAVLLPELEDDRPRADGSTGDGELRSRGIEALMFIEDPSLPQLQGLDCDGLANSTNPPKCRRAKGPADQDDGADPAQACSPPLPVVSLAEAANRSM
jgi:hypothetical protein